MTHKYTYVIHIYMMFGKPDARAIGRRIRAHRRWRHMTQAELARAIGIRAGPLSALENGHHLPSVPVLVNLAKAFGVETGELLGAVAPAQTLVRESGVTHVRRACSDRIFSAIQNEYAAEQARIIRFEPEKHPLDPDAVRRLDVVMNVFLALEDICEVQKRAAIPLRLKLPALETGLAAFASRIRVLLGISDAVIFDYLELFENAGLRVVFLPLDTGVESISCYDRDCENAFFFIAADMNVERQLFRLAYELGRIYLFTGGMRKRNRMGALDAKHAAKRLAALLLMPDEAVIASVRQTGIPRDRWTWALLMRLKHRFGASAESFLYRLEELDLITPARRNEIKERIYAHYEKTGWKEPDSSRRILSPNGRLGDLILSAELHTSDELPDLKRALKRAGVAV